jgi:hypothetical protein
LCHTRQAAARAVRGKPAGNAAAASLVREAVKKRGKADDITIVVMDVDLNGHAPLAAHKVDKAHEHPPVKLVPKYPLVMHNTGACVGSHEKCQGLHKPASLFTWRRENE